METLEKILIAHQSKGKVTDVAPVALRDAAFPQPSSDGNSMILFADGGQTAHRIDLVPASLPRLSGDIFLLFPNPGEATWLLLADGANLSAVFSAGKRVSRMPEMPARSPLARGVRSAE